MTSAQPAVGLLLNGVTTEVLAAQPNAVDFVEVIPEMLWVDRGRAEPDRFGDIPVAVAQLELLAARYPIVGHGVGLSIGSSVPTDTGHVRRVREWLARWDVEAFSEHLGFARVRANDGHERHVGLGFPLPCDEDVLLWLAARVRRLMDSLERPILLENGVRHTPIINEDMGEAEFMNRLAATTGCGMLLDLHNLYTDYRNNGWEPLDYLEQLDPSIVRELHIAGGSVIGRAYTDSHSGRCPPDVWDLLTISVARFPDVERVTFEFNDSYYSGIGRDGVLYELAHTRSICTARVAV